MGPEGLSPRNEGMRPGSGQKRPLEGRQSSETHLSGPLANREMGVPEQNAEYSWNLRLKEIEESGTTCSNGVEVDGLQLSSLGRRFPGLSLFRLGEKKNKGIGVTCRAATKRTKDFR